MGAGGGNSLSVCKEEPPKTHPISEPCMYGLPREQQHRFSCAVVALTEALELLTCEDDTVKEKELSCVFLQQHRPDVGYRHSLSAALSLSKDGQSLSD